MIVICKKNFKENIQLITGKSYEAISNKVYSGGYVNYYRVINENKVVYNFPEKFLSEYFYTLAEWREIQINSILD